ncbi:GNAT family N-acetyltransferase [Qipengyuania sediminis]|uniref:GNAT family N-acetyltransferase n=1 Tax=Qipengyuania sediminis TaxID=1532023 RepID=UPI001F105153|nr:GNAT family N-acetyltransferase [Qipengyuania sediminis]
MTRWTLRLARDEDADAMPGVERAAAALFADQPGLEALDTDQVWSPEDFRRLIRRGHCLVAHVAGALAAFIAAEPFGRELHVWELSVAPQFQRGGVGAGLLRAAMIDARNAGFAALTLTTFRDIAWNAPFYARMGFVEVPDHPRLAKLLAEETAHGLPPGRRCAMRRPLD